MMAMSDEDDLFAAAAEPPCERCGRTREHDEEDCAEHAAFLERARARFREVFGAPI